MKKIFVFGLIASFIPVIGFAENPQITRLMREKQAKMEQLEKCMGSTKGLKIAGISTLGLTAVGVAGNIAEASAIKKYDSQIEATDNKIEKTQNEINEKRDKIAREEEEKANSIKQARMLKNVAANDINTINASGGNIGDKAISHGYMPEQLPDNLRSQFANAMVGFISRCRALIGTNGIQEVSLSPSVQENWRQFVGSTPLSEEALLSNLNEHIIAECKITQCNTATHNTFNNNGITMCVEKSSAPVDTTKPTADAILNNKPSTKPAVGSDCLANVKANNPDATSAKINANGECEIIDCGAIKKPSSDKKSCIGVFENDFPNMWNKSSGNNVKTEEELCQEAATKGETYVQYISNPPVCVCNDNQKEWNGTKCVAKKSAANKQTIKKASEWTDTEKKAKPDEYCKLAFQSDAAKACCLAIHKYNQAYNWDGAGMKCNCKTGLEWKNNTCAPKMNIPTLANDATYVAQPNIIEPIKMPNTGYTYTPGKPDF
ncbi:MAG: hypothetical protein IKZ49_04185 [Alphaproteobacteria bacterium]|nr:hypothetical protein [Alphaproteobacteria bacterium]